MSLIQDVSFGHDDNTGTDRVVFTLAKLDLVNAGGFYPDSYGEVVSEMISLVARHYAVENYGDIASRVTPELIAEKVAELLVARLGLKAMDVPGETEPFPPGPVITGDGLHSWGKDPGQHSWGESK